MGSRPTSASNYQKNLFLCLKFITKCHKQVTPQRLAMYPGQYFD